MNERIKKLAEQAYDDLVNQTGNIVVFDEDFQQRFAELIVQECKAVMLDMMNNKQGDFNTLDLALTEINEHFGVE